MVIKCKMCGGELNITEESNICECEFCGTQQTIPVIDNEKKVNLFNRANRLRMNAEFDKAATVYASITAEFPEEAEAYWGLCLCKYGIEYVDDPLTGKKIPTCHRTLTESIMDDEDFIQACENADPVAKKVYREEARAIDILQQDILSVVSGEAPYDVFICYKETDAEGNRTEDSVLAQDIYDSLTGKGLKVFFSRISLEDKLGKQYEPYIYAALHSSKVMLAVGTQYDYFDAVWVKNEWARFLDMMKSDKSKTLIPCYKGIDAYDMPREFKNLQAQDMGKLGWLQDLTRGVMKLCGKGTDSAQKPVVTAQPVTSNGPTVVSLLERANIFLEDGKWQEADQYADKALDIEPKNGRAYLVKLMALRRFRNEREVLQSTTALDNNEHYQKVIRFGDEELRNKVEGWNRTILEQVEKARKQAVLQTAGKDLEKARTMEEHDRILENLQTVQDFAGAEDMVRKVTDHRDRLEKLNQVSRMLNEEEALLSRHGKLMAELKNLRGLFSGKRRDELETQIADTELKYEQLEQKLGEVTGIQAKGLNEQSITGLRYRRGMLFYNAGFPLDAAMVFQKIRDFGDINERIQKDPALAEAMDQAKVMKFRTKGETVVFGEREWIVLDVKDDRAMLLSKYTVSEQPYNYTYADVTWESSYMRKWLNNEFVRTSFSDEECAAILTTQVDNSGQPGTQGARARGCRNTQDKAFLLNAQEAAAYLRTDAERICYEASRVGREQVKKAVWWWLRSPGTTFDMVEGISYDGSFLESRVDDQSGPVRPAIWIDLNAKCIG